MCKALAHYFARVVAFVLPLIGKLENDMLTGPERHWHIWKTHVEETDVRRSEIIWTL